MIGKRQGTRRSGFTLIEVLLVIVIIGVMAGMLVVNLSGRSQDARIARAKSDVCSTLSLALDMYEQDTGRYPTTEEGLEALVSDPGVEGWRGSYLKGKLNDDPWGTPYEYQVGDEGKYSLLSAGPDTQAGTEDDIAQ